MGASKQLTNIVSICCKGLCDQDMICLISISFSGPTLIHVYSYTAIIGSNTQLCQYTHSQVYGRSSELLGRRFATTTLSNPCMCTQLGGQMKICLGWDLNPKPFLPDTGTVTITPLWLCPIGLAQGSTLYPR